ncbi:unnamed protein product [Absidia cylindrospora]
MTSFASTLSHPDWKFWILATPSGSGPDVVDLEEEPGTTAPDSMFRSSLDEDESRTMKSKVCSLIPMKNHVATQSTRPTSSSTKTIIPTPPPPQTTAPMKQMMSIPSLPATLSASPTVGGHQCHQIQKHPSTSTGYRSPT